jgi:hypothetical protein
MANKKNFHLRYAVCISGAAESGHCAADALEKAQAMGREIAKRDFILITGATTGIPYWAAQGAKEAGGFVIGFSPAASKISHQQTYHLPVDYHDVIVYTGFGYSGRNLLLTRASDAVIVICGRMGTLNEFTIAFEDQRPIGILEGTGGTADMIEDLVAKSHRGPGKIVYASKPAELLDKIVELIKQEEL